MTEENLHIENHQEENSHIDEQNEQNQDESNTENTNDESMGDLYLDKIKKLPLDEALRISKEFNSFVLESRNEKISELVSNLKESVDKYQIPAEDLLKKISETFPDEFKKLTASKKNKKSSNNSRSNTTKYFHPTDESKTWNGQGRQPKWLTDLCVNGKTKEDFKTDPKEQGKSNN